MKFHLHIMIIGILFGGCITQQFAIRSENPVIDFEVHHNILIVEAYVNHKWAKFVVDTGASISLLDYNQSKKYKFKYFTDTESMKLTGFGGRSKLMRTAEVSFQLYGPDGHSKSFFASDLNGLNNILSASNQTVLGILGSDFLQTHGAIIDYKSKRIVLTNPF